MKKSVYMLYMMFYLMTALCIHTDLQEAHVVFCWGFLRSFATYLIVQFIIALF